MANDLAALQTASVTVLSEIQKQAEGLAKQLQSIAPPQEMNSASAQYLLDTAAQLGEAVMSIGVTDAPDQHSAPRPG